MGKKGFVVLGILGIIAAIHIVGAVATGVVFWEIEKKKAIKQEVVVQQSEKLEKMEVKNGRDSENKKDRTGLMFGFTVLTIVGIILLYVLPPLQHRSRTIRGSGGCDASAD